MYYFSYGREPDAPSSKDWMFHCSHANFLYLTFGLPSNLGTCDLKIDDTAGALFILLPSYRPGPGPSTCRDQTTAMTG